MSYTDHGFMNAIRYLFYFGATILVIYYYIKTLRKITKNTNNLLESINKKEVGSSKEYVSKRDFNKLIGWNIMVNSFSWGGLAGALSIFVFHEHNEADVFVMVTCFLLSLIFWIKLYSKRKQIENQLIIVEVMES